MGRLKLARYRAHVYDTVANMVDRFEAKVNLSFGLNPDEVTEVHKTVAAEIRSQARPRPLLMVTVSTRSPGPSDEPEHEPGYCLGMRFCRAEDVAHVEKLLVKQVRDRYPMYRGMKPREVRQALWFTVWVVPEEPTRGGWPIYDGPTGYWY